MKKSVVFVFLMVLALLCSCEVESLVGTIGPAGGYIFYDCDADNMRGNGDGLKSKDCGWRYLEAAPSDIRVASTTTDIIFGYYRTSATGTNLFVNGYNYFAGTSIATDGKSTGTAIGTGAANTTKLVNAMKSSAYTTSQNGNETTAAYAAKLCADYQVPGFDDWFLPSIDELRLMYTQLRLTGRGGFSYTDSYWSSSEGSMSGFLTLYINFADGIEYSGARFYAFKVRAIRAFL